MSLKKRYLILLLFLILAAFGVFVMFYGDFFSRSLEGESKFDSGSKEGASSFDEKPALGSDPEAVESAIEKLSSDETVEVAYREIFAELQSGKVGVYLENIEKVLPVLIKNLSHKDGKIAESSALLLGAIIPNAVYAEYYRSHASENQAVDSFSEKVLEKDGELEHAIFNAFEHTNVSGVRKWLAGLIPVFEPNQVGVDLLLLGLGKEKSSSAKEYIFYALGFAIDQGRSEINFGREGRDIILREFSRVDPGTVSAAYDVMDSIDMAEKLPAVISVLSKTDREYVFQHFLGILKDNRSKIKNHVSDLEAQLLKLNDDESKAALRELIESIKESH